MTAGRKRRPAAVSARRKEAVRAALSVPGKRPPGAPLPDTRLPLARRPDGLLMQIKVFEGTSERLWSKGSARGAGPQQQRGAVAVGARAKWVRCEDCGSGRPAGAAGRHGAMPVTGPRLAAVADWPLCRHGAPWWQNCRAAPVPPPCCGGGA
jgi:hypothetical protein